MHNTNLDLENLKLTEHIKKLMMSIPPEDPIERRKYIIELNKKGVAANPPEIKYLTGANIQNLPSKLKAIVLRAEEDEEFYIKIKKVNPTSAQKIDEALKNLANDGMPNFFGYQRFGRDGDSFKQAQEMLKGDIFIEDNKIKNFFIIQTKNLIKCYMI